MAQFEIQKLDTLFNDVQTNKVFPDGKTFVDSLPKASVEEINTRYYKEKNKPEFSLKKFVLENFDLPVPHSNNYSSDTSKTVETNIETLWAVLTRQPGNTGGSLIPLPHPYIVPGGRFGEIYYWDSYFTMLGLKASGKNEMLENMVKNFSHLIDTLGYVPNGNRSYFIGRSQPPFYSLMIKLLSEAAGSGVLLTYLPQLEKEYHFWMHGADALSEKNTARDRVVKMPGGEIMNRYWDENDTARPESYREDIELSHQSSQQSSQLFRHLRAGAESGWDFSSRWFKEKNTFDTIHTTDIIPVDLNCLLWHLENTIAEAYLLKGDVVKEKIYRLFSEKRRGTIEKYCWNNDAGFYVDYDWTSSCQKDSFTLAGVAPLFFNISSVEKALKVSSMIKEKFMRPGGVVTTLETTGQQWDAPNGWAPLQWMTITGLNNYKENDLATEIATRWIKLNTAIFKRTGKLMEKYNVTDTDLVAGGGEYEGQDGFGWTNGVLLALIKKYGHSPV
jgi:alpha,alpha-trehalase